MSRDHGVSIEQRIRQLGARTEAPATFLDQVRRLFARKGIPLSDDSAPYTAALDEAFRREERIRRSTLDAQRNLDRLKVHFKSIGSSYRRQLDQLRKIQRALERRARHLEEAATTRHAPVRTTDDSRRYVSRVQKDDPFLVPGPDEVQ